VRPRAAATLTAALALLAAVAPAPACVALHKGDIYRSDLDQVFVAYFENETFYRDLQFQLTEKVVAEILSSPGLRLSSKDDAEVVLTGSLLDVEQQVLAEDPSQVPVLTGVTLTVEVRVSDSRTGAVLRSSRLTQRGESAPSRDEDPAFAQNEAMRYLARDIVRLLEEDF
jgi:hypothetical protein